MSHYNEALIDALRKDIPQFISGKRLAHTYAVERECAALAEIFCRHPLLLSREDAYRLRIAALLHDITKEKTPAEHCRICAEHRIPLCDMELAAPKVLHAKPHLRLHALSSIRTTAGPSQTMLYATQSAHTQPAPRR